MAVMLMSDFIQLLKGMPMPAHDILGECSACITYISCSDPGKAAIVPAEASVRFDRRYLPAETPESVYAGLDDLLKQLTRDNPDFRYKLTTNYVMPPCFVEPESPIVQFMQRAVTKVRGAAARYKTWLAGTDGAFMVNDFGIPTIGLGPGFEADIHSDRDHVSGQHLLDAAGIYEEIVRTSESV